MLVVGILLLAGLGLFALSGAPRRGTVIPPIVATRPAATPRPPVPARESDLYARGGGPPGLLLRREPEIRGLPDEALGDYIRVVRQFFMGGNIPTEAWWTSFVQAQSEVLLRNARRTGRTSDLADPQVNALRAWIAALRDRGMPLDSSEEALASNVSEDADYREGHPEARRPGEDMTAPEREAILAANEDLRRQIAEMEGSAS